MLNLPTFVETILRLSDGRWLVFTRDELYVYANADPPTDADLLQTIDFPADFGWPATYGTQAIEGNDGYVYRAWGNTSTGASWVSRCAITDDFSVQSNWKKMDGTSGYDIITISGSRSDARGMWWDSTLGAPVILYHTYSYNQYIVYWNGSNWQANSLSLGISGYQSAGIQVGSKYYLFVENVYTYDIHVFEMSNYSDTAPIDRGHITDALYPLRSANYYDPTTGRIYIGYMSNQSGADKGIWYLDTATGTLTKELATTWQRAVYGRCDGTSDFLIFHSGYTSGGQQYRVGVSGTDVSFGSGTLGVTMVASQLGVTTQYKPIYCWNYNTSAAEIYFIDTGETGGAPSGETAGVVKNSMTSVTIKGRVTDMGSASSLEVWLEWGTSPSYGNSGTHHVLTSPSEISETITITPGVTYYYRLAMYDGSTTYYSSGDTFIIDMHKVTGTKVSEDSTPVTITNGSRRATSHVSTRIVGKNNKRWVHLLTYEGGTYYGVVREIDTTTNVISSEVKVYVGGDDHCSGTLMMDSSGYLHLISGDHGYTGEMAHYKSDNPYDISSWTKVGVIPANYPTYPEAVIDSSDNIHLIYRGYDPGSTHLYYQKKTPTNNWGDILVDLFDGTEATRYYRPSYMTTLTIYNDILHIGLHVFDYTGNYGVKMGYMMSDDGGATWKKSDGTVYSLPVTRSTIETIVDYPSGNTRSSPIYVDSSGNPYFVVMELNSNTKTFYIHKSGTWNSYNIDVPAGKNIVDNGTITEYDGKIYYIAAYGDSWFDTTGANTDNYMHVSSDGGQNWTLTKIIDEPSTSSWSATAERINSFNTMENNIFVADTRGGTDPTIVGIGHIVSGVYSEVRPVGGVIFKVSGTKVIIP